MRAPALHTSEYVTRRRLERQRMRHFTASEWQVWVHYTCRVYYQRPDWQRWYPFVVAPSTSVSKAARMVAGRAADIRALHDACAAVLDVWHPAHDGQEATFVMLEFVLNAMLTHVPISRNLWRVGLHMQPQVNNDDYNQRLNQIAARSRPFVHPDYPAAELRKLGHF